MARKTDKQMIAGIKKYCTIMEQLQKVDVSIDADFQKMFNGFYRMRQRPASYYEAFYSYLEANKRNPSITYQEILEHLFQSCGRMEASFSSKMLATIRPEMPIWDTRVLANLGIKPPYSNDKDRLQEVVACYDQICQWYAADRHIDLVVDFNAAYPGWKISDTKKIDFILWREDPGEEDEWKDVSTDEDIAELMSTCGDFHDCCIVSMRYQSGVFTEEKQAMHFGDASDHQLVVRFNSQWKPREFELCFTGLRQTHLAAWQDNYLPCMLEAHLAFYSNLLQGKSRRVIIWSDNGWFDPAKINNSIHEPSDTYIVANALKWRIIE